MSGRDRRGKRDIDYSIFHSTGRKVDKVRDEMTDVREEKRVKEIQICDDLEEAFTLYAPDDLETEDEVSEGLAYISDLGKEYRHIHIELKELLGEELYAQSYPESKVTERVRKYTKDARERKRTISKGREVEIDEEALKAEEEKKREEEAESVKASFLIEEKAFQDKLNNEIDSFTLVDIDEIKGSCSRFESLLDEYFKMLPKARHIFGLKFEADFQTKFEGTVAKIRKQISDGKSTVRTLYDGFEKKRAQDETEKNQKAKQALDAEHLFNAKTLSSEIKLRSNALVLRCDCSNLKSLSDHQILELYRKVPFIDTELREIFDKFTAFSQAASLCGDQKDALLVEPKRLQDEALLARNNYYKELHGLVSSRDISEEKLKNSASLTIELSKFKGYESKHDIYTFKSEFEKLVQPRVQKTLWLHILKNNYLEGPALVLVDKLETIDEAWKVLTNAYGNIKLLLQNKIGSLSKMECLDKIKGDEKIMVAIAKIINAMTELSTLAQKHSLEYKLYVGGGLEKVLSLIGSERERKFVSKSVSSTTPSPGVDSSDLDEKQEWKNLLAFLQKEYAIREKLTMAQKSKDCLGIKTDERNPKGKYPGSGPANHTKPDEGLLCPICNQPGHVVSVSQAGQKFVDYYSCEIFAHMSGSERQDKLRSLGFCLQCLVSGAKPNEKHRCYTKYKCPNSYHNQYPKGIHVLLCSAHKNDQKNITLLKEFKEKIIAKRSDKFLPFTKNIGLVCNTVSEVSTHTVNFPGVPSDKIIPDVKDNAGFQLQTISVEGHSLNLFFDDGCGDIVIKKTALDILLRLGRAILEFPGPLKLKGVGDHLTISEHGAYSICLPLKNGMNVTLSGICLDRVTAEFRTYSLKTVEQDIRAACEQTGDASLLDRLPKLPAFVGGNTDILIGSKYLKIHPKQIWMSPSGLTISESPFFSADGTSGVVHGPHSEFNMTIDQGNNAYLVSEVIAYRNAFRLCCSTPILADRQETDDAVSARSYEDQNHSEEPSIPVSLVTQRAPRCMKTFLEVDSAGIEVSYRCSKCRLCPDCKRSSRIDAVSIEEENEQELVD